ncbi:TCR/Tet family MFS transporter [Sedimentimonas flavescens]|uniref:TCR/Tet family MFS transporter n=1 Tax=Sedimentimonas flavescens TaxID=2851012 RepID=UPI001C4A43B0|nr:TCR/Tet family MFS transporter [Sedimentimonas flavescens]MBW0157724.1 TCR/Tet family MFS transporter [Sedimentimonas flavescens]MCT2540804.1 TCR/Tet family MFS transporter [Sedimentimonas flavescens]WBL31950.1 TCR/Tet family MFS transporter [Sinirhodobacter sp. HNIBRBA609]
MTKAPGRHAVSFVLLLVFLDMVGLGLILPVLPKLIETVGDMDLAEASRIGGGMFAAFSLAQFVFSPLAGALSDRFGRRPLLLLAIAGLGVDYIFHALAPSVLWLFVGRIVAGACGSSYVIANAFLADVTAPEARAKAFGMLGAAFGMGFVLGPAIGGLLGELGPRVPFWVAAAISFANLVYGYFVLPETLPPEKRRAFRWREANPLGVLAVFARHKGVLPLGAVLAVYFFGSAVYPAIWSFWGIAKFGWSEAMVGISLAAFGIVWAVFQGVLTGPAVRLWGEWRVAMVGLIIAVLACAGYGFANGIIAVVALLVFHGPEGFVNPMLAALMSRAVPEDEQGALQGGISAAMNLAMLLGTLFFTQVFGYFLSDAAPFRSPDMAYFVAAVTLLVALAMFWPQFRRARG